ncbi:MAG: energy-coupling factor transporter transmembrane protein EcfT [Candidatus Verstraetearchaeota archaeon]|jgi:energy-coupling factor transport system permease protein|nr:energy-coupling factor transporter transmembrane protein EcfT [Candidatus Verstraetearchaeota archaeon]
MKIFEFEYKCETSIIHKLDPRAKLVYVILFTVLTIYFTNPLILLLIFLSSVPMAILGKIVRKWLISIKSSLFFIIFIFLFNFIGIFWTTGKIIDTIIISIAMTIRFISLISIFSIFFLSTSPEDLMQSMIKLKIPYEYVLTFNMAIRFVPTLAREAQTIIDAQRSRGLEFEKGNIFQKVKKYIPILIPLIISSLRRAEVIADAMESRAFGASKTRSFLYTLTMSKKDFIFISICIITFTIFLFLRMFSYIQ